MDEIRGLSVCSGIGGIELALGLAIGERFRTDCYVEKDPYAAATLVARMAEETLGEAPVWSDLATFDGLPWRGRIDIVYGGIPCQPNSLAGRRGGVHDERWLLPELIRIITEIQPRLVLIENVPGLLSVSGGDVPHPAYGRLRDLGWRALGDESALTVGGGGFGHVLGDLAQIGFDAEWCVRSAADVGAPHLRERVFVLARRREMGDAPGAGRPRDDERESASPDVAGSGEHVANTRHGASDGIQLEQQVGGGESPGAVPTDDCGDGEILADPSSRGLGIKRSADLEGGERHADLGGARDVANGHGGRLGGDRVEEHGELEGARRREPDGSGDDRRFGGASVADPERVRRSGDGDGGERGEPRSAASSSPHGGDGPRVGIASEHDGLARQGHRNGDALDIPVWPSGPSDTAGWARIPGDYQPAIRRLTPGAKSELRGLADGVSAGVGRPASTGDADDDDGMGAADAGAGPRRALEAAHRNRRDRLRVLGNAVVAPAVALAFAELAARLGVTAILRPEIRSILDD